ncbi:hypothetical protein TIFTF001_032883 [Ficus carica]|uniref:Retrotransposon gag domain-containing protein n=1 Tax=Ficus carica TaxID=3494 RepID=A0AA88DY78_FICCA|nr:hypothetical protein TIFTF001_032883 [Ficus carica]
MASKLPRVVPTCLQVRFGPWFELDWTGRPNHSIAARHVVLAERKQTSYVYTVGGTLQSWYQSGFPSIHFHGLPASATVITCGRGSIRCLDLSRDEPIVIDRTRRTVSLAGWLNDMETIFRVCHIEAHFQVVLASRCLAGNARLWWLTLWLPDVQGLAWADFRAFILARFGPLPYEGANRPYRNPKIYNDMYRRRYLSYVVECWMTRSGGHCISLETGYCWKLSVAPVDDYMVEPVDDAGIAVPLFQGGPVWPEDPIPAIPLQEIPLEEAGTYSKYDMYRSIVRHCRKENPIPPVVPQVPEVHQEIPWNAEVPLAPARVQANPPLIREDLLYERFRRMKAPEFERPADPIEAKTWNMTTMSWQDFITEFRAMYYNWEIIAAQQNEFNSFRQGSMTIMEVVKKFEKLARLCPELVPNETEKVRRMMKMFQTDIAKQLSDGSNPPTLVSDCISRAIRAEYWINQDKEAMSQIFKAKKEEKAILERNKRKGNATSQGQQRSYPQKKFNRVVGAGSKACYIYGKEGHYARNCTLSNQNSNPQFQNRNPSSQLHTAQVKIEGPFLAQGKLEAPEPQARIYAYTKGDIEAGTSSVVTGVCPEIRKKS